MKKLFILAGFGLFGVASFAQSSIAVGTTCPDFTATDVDGNTHNLYDYCEDGKYVIIDFFAYWCGPCMATAPTIQQFYTKYGCNEGDVIVIGIESDPNSTLADLESFKQGAGLTGNSFPDVLGSTGGNTIKNTYGVSAYPTIVLIGPDKKMINNDIWPISGVGTLEGAFPATADITEMECATASISQSELNASLEVYPNPANDHVTIAVESIQELTISDASGRQVFVAQYDGENQVELSLTDFEAGIYLVTVKTAQGLVSSRFTKQ